MTGRIKANLETTAFVKAGNISVKETHVDYSEIDNTVVTWCLSNEPQNRQVPSVNVRSKQDILKIAKLEKRIRELNNKLYGVNHD